MSAIKVVVVFFFLSPHCMVVSCAVLNGWSLKKCLVGWGGVSFLFLPFPFHHLSDPVIKSAQLSLHSECRINGRVGCSFGVHRPERVDQSRQLSWPYSCRPSPSTVAVVCVTIMVPCLSLNSPSAESAAGAPSNVSWRKNHSHRPWRTCGRSVSQRFASVLG